MPNIFLRFIAAVVLCLSGTVAWAEVPPARLALLAKGINLNAWFTPWSPPADSSSSFRPEEAAFLRAAGFTVCRLPLAPNLLFDADHPDVPRPALAAVDRGVRMLLDAGLAVVFDPIHGSSSSVEWETGLAHDPAFLAKADAYWEALARHFAAVSSDRIFFEIMNEPHLTAREKIDPSWWAPVQAELAAAIRRGAPDNTIIATGERWGGIDGLVALEPLADPNVVYSFHWYDPFTFTHQGAGWAGPLQAALAGVPYPSSPEAVAGPAEAITDPKARAAVIRYGADRWGADRVLAGLTRASEWARNHHVSVFCGEFGAYRAVSPAADRAVWLADVRRSLESLGIGWSMWDYETDFGLVTWKEPRWRRGPQVDASYLTALGLNTQATLQPRPGETLAADFISGAARELELPVDSWVKLWTSDPGAGSESFEPESGPPVNAAVVHTGAKDWSLGSGFPLALTPGQRYTLSSVATLEGAGTLSLTLVARDAAGKVTNWSFASVKVAEGSSEPVATSFTVPPDVATLEPRWSGSGPSKFSVGAFRIVRDAS
jgi:hypothetical protein